MNKEILNKSLQIEQLEDRFEMTSVAADAERCTVTTEDVNISAV